MDAGRPDRRRHRRFLAPRPGEAEETAIGGLVAAARDTGARVHVVHLADAGALPLLRRARTTHREALWAALGDGDIDCVVSDHSPCTPELKRLDVGDFGLAWGGIASLQVALPAVWTGARARGIGLDRVVRWMAEAPAALAGLPGKGAIAVGRDADLVDFAPEERFTVGQLEHRNPVTPYAGRALTGVVRRTWLRGEPADGAPRGRLLRRGEPAGP